MKGQFLTPAPAPPRSERLSRTARGFEPRCLSIRGGLAVLGSLFVLAFGASSVSASKGGDSFIGVTGPPPTGAAADGGAFNSPLDVAADHETGQIYVADDKNHRIQRFDAAGNFELAWGGNVSESDVSGDGGGVFEVCITASDCQAGTAGIKGGMLDNPSGVAVDPDTGDLLVADRDSRRIQRFGFDDNGTPADPSDDLPAFEWAAGSNVVSDGGTGDKPGPSEVQRVRFGVEDGTGGGGEPPGGTFTITFDGQTTGPISWPPSQAAMQAELEALSNIAPGDVTVSAPEVEPISSTRYFLRWSVAFGGAYSLVDVPALSISGSGLTGSINSPLIEAVPEGGSNPEVCTVAAECLAGVRGQSAAAFNSFSDGSQLVKEFTYVPTTLDVSKDGSPGTGQLFVTDPGNRRIMEFDLDGAFVRAWGAGVDSGGTGFEICTTASGCERGNTTLDGFSAVNGGFVKDTPQEVAVGIDGFVYATSGIQGGARLLRFDSTVPGEDEAAATAMLLPGPVGSGPGQPLLFGVNEGLEVDPLTGNLLYLVDGSADSVVQELDTTVEPLEEVDRHMEGSGPEQAVTGLGLLHGAGGDKLFVSSDAGAIEHRVLVLDNDGNGPFEITMLPVSGLGPHEATFNATVNAKGPTVFAVSHNFQYSADGGQTWTTIPASEGPFSDGEDHAVEDAVSDLEANTEYLVRLSGTRAFNGGLNQSSAPISFKTPAAPPVVQTLESTLRTDTTAVLVGSLNPEGSPTAWHFEYGTDTSYGQSTPVTIATGGKARLLTAEVGGLQPETTYHYRLVADNGQEIAPGDTTVEGADAAVTTRAPSPPGSCPNEALRTGLSAALPDCRAYEMVSPPFKVTRTIGGMGAPRSSVNPGVPSLDGETIAWRTWFFPLTEEVQSPNYGDLRHSRRTGGGWVDRTLNTRPVNPTLQTAGAATYGGASSGDLRTMTFLVGQNQISFLPNEGDVENTLYTIREGTGTDGFTNWVTNPELQVCAFWSEPCPTVEVGKRVARPAEGAVLNDAGTAMLRWGEYRGLGEDPSIPGDEDLSDGQQLAGESGGRTAYAQRVSDPDELPAAAKELVGECTGTNSATATKLPSRTASATIATRNCTGGALVSARGAIGGGEGTQRAVITGTALSDDGKRIFFTAPDPKAGPASCEAATGVSTNCPAQLYVRQYGPDGEESVRWISRSRSVSAGDGSYTGALIAGQDAGLLKEAIFQRASRDGRYVYFRTASPLTPDDPSDTSSDLYRYELPSDLSTDPDQGRLLRISGGPSGSADPEAPAGALRFHSDDGSRAYFLTAAPIAGAGADSTPPTGGASAPGGATGGQTSRNLYLFDAGEAGADRWRFIARVPTVDRTANVVSMGKDPARVSDCTTGPAIGIGPQMAPRGIYGVHPNTLNCFRGTPDGGQVIFVSAAPLTSDDDDQAGDIFLYSAERDELTRISASQNAEAVPYPCLIDNNSNAVSHASCNAHLSEVDEGSNSRVAGVEDSARGWNGMRYENVAVDANGVVSVFFMSRSELLPEDTNGDYTDVYQWREGELSLLSPGNAPSDAWYSGNSLDGEDVFFMSGQRIDPREIDPVDLDFYDARVGGGFPYTPPAVPCDVLAFACESAATPGSAAPSPSSLAPTSGNLQEKKPRACRKGKVRRKGRCVAKKPRACRKGKVRRKGRCVAKKASRKGARKQRGSGRTGAGR